MATTTRTLDANVNGVVYTGNANGALEALDTCHSGATAPTDEVANGKLWLDTSATPSVLKVYDDGAWNVIYSARGDFTVNGDLDVASTGAAKLPVGTDAERPTAATGQMRFNTTTNSFEGYNGSAWGDIGGVGDTLDVANISDGTDTVETGYVVNGSAKAWVNFNGTGTVAIRDSLNVASLTDIGTGLCTINLTNSMGNVGYSVTNSVDGSGVVSGAMTEISSYSTGNFRVRGMNTQSGYADTDFTTQACSAHGDLA